MSKLLISPKDRQPISGLIMYPNHAATTVTIGAESELRHIELYDVQGRVLQSSKVSGLNFSLDVSARAKGVYFIKIATEKGAGVEKVMKL